MKPVPGAALGVSISSLAAVLLRDLDVPAVVSYRGDATLLTTVVALFLFLLTLTRLRALVALGTAALGLAWLAVAFSPLVPALSRDLVRRDPIQPADAVFVLSSRQQEDGELTSPAMSRLLRGLELVGQGLAPRLVLSEQTDGRPPYAPVARQLIEHLGLEVELLTVGPVRNTHDEAVLVARLARERSFAGLILVTSPLHSRRAAAAFEHAGVRVLSAPGQETRFDIELLQRPDERLAAFGDVMHERVGLFVYRRRGWIN